MSSSSVRKPLLIVSRTDDCFALGRVVVLFVMAVVALRAATAEDSPGNSKPQESPARRYTRLDEQQLKRVERKSYDAGRASAVPFVLPRMIRSAGGKLVTTLEAKYVTRTLGTDSVTVRSYDGEMLGPTLSVKPGDLLSLRLINKLPPGTTPVNGHDQNVTNLHTHGLQVSPEGNSDNVFLSVKPGAIYDFDIAIPSWHLSGAYWYHAHHHGSVSVQVSSGMAGMIVIEGGLDEIPEISIAKDLPFVFQQCPYDSTGRVESPDQIQEWGGLNRPSTINGQVQPVLDMSPGEIQRWRFVHAGIAERLDLVLVDNADDPAVQVPFHEIAADGIPLGFRRATCEIGLGPGYRSEVLVQAPMTGGPFYLVDKRAAVGRSLQRDRDEPAKVLMRIELHGASRSMVFPSDDTLSQVRRPDPVDSVPPKQLRELVFKGNDINSAKINGKQFSPDRTDIVVKAGHVEEWCLRTAGDGNGPHPFHIHVNPFYTTLVDPCDKTKSYGVWKDTLLVNDGELLRVKMKFHEKLPGKTVLHCHRLDHEDFGMMQVLRICDDAALVACSSSSAVPLPDLSAASEAPEWRLADAHGKEHASRDLHKGPLLLVLFRGFGCLHCVEQIKILSKHRDELAARGYQVVLVSSDSQSDLQSALQGYEDGVPFPILSNRSLTLFRALRCVNDGGNEPQHGVFVIDGNGKIRWSHVSEKALLDERMILGVSEQVKRAPE